MTRIRLCGAARPFAKGAPGKSASIWNFGAVAQLGERCNGIAEVRGSIPLGSTKLHRKTRATGPRAVEFRWHIRDLGELPPKPMTCKKVYPL